MGLSVVISYYKAQENLKLILEALKEQSCLDFEVIVSEDDCNEETVRFLEKNARQYPFEINHLCQKEDDGFRKNEMLNRSVKAAKYDKIAFIDGDCVPHKHFVKSYIQQISDDSLNWGRRVMVGPKKTTELKQKGSVKELSFMSLLLSDSKKVKDGLYSSFFNLSYKFRGVKGCNWGILKKNLLEVNGFDEDYVRAGVGEDDDISWRLLEKGLKPVSMKNKAIVYHLHHPRGYSNEGVKLNRDMFRNKQKEYKLSCVNGMEKLTK